MKNEEIYDRASVHARKEEPRKILIVDDEPGIIRLMVDILQHHIPQVVLASTSDGREVHEQIATFSPDLVILDLLMPGMNGVEVCRHIKTSPKTQGLKILMITGLPEHQSLKRALSSACDVDEYLFKPFDAEALVKKVRALLMKNSTE